jgi:beta-lactamase regulating signal transducer with metallopeptidase domain
VTLLAATVLNALWQDALLVVFVWLLLRVFPRTNAATRYVVWSSALIAAILVPVATTYASFVERAPFDKLRVTERAPFDKLRVTERAPFDKLRVTERAPFDNLRVTKVEAPKRWLEVPDRLRLTIPTNVARVVVAVWALLAGYALFGLLIGLWRLERLKRDALPLPVEYRDAMPEWQRANKGRRAVRLCVSEAIDVPVAIGLFDSMILIPRDLLDRLSPSEVEQISLHELAHLRRGDDWSNCLQRIVVAALGWNPAAIFVAQQLELEREVACDDWVLSSVQSVRPYAMCLTKMAETAAWPHHPMPAPGVFTTRKQISLRIERLLAGGRDIATTLSLGPAAAAVAGVAAAAFVIAMVAPSIAAPAIEPVASMAALPQTKPLASVAPVSRATPHVKTIERIKTVERVIRITRITPAAIATPLHPVQPASSMESMGMALARTALADARSLGENGASEGSVPARSCDGCDYHGVNWAGRDLRGANYNGVEFAHATLEGVNLAESRISGSDFTRANLTSASFHHAQLSGCDFSHATLVRADFSGALITDCTFGNARLDGANFNGAKLVDCDLDGVDRHRVDLSHARIVDDAEDLEQPPPP